MDADLSTLQRYDQMRDPEAFTRLVGRHGAMVYAAALRVTGNAADADDVTQECFIELARKAAQIHTSVAGWLHLAATNHAKNLKRGAARQRAASEAGAAVPKLQATEWAEIAPLLDEVLAELPDEQRLPLIAHYLEGRTQGEVAAELGLSQPTVSRRIDEGLRTLRDKLKARGVESGAPQMGVLLAAFAGVPMPAAVKTGLAKIGLVGMGAMATTAGATTSGGAAKVIALTAVLALVSAGAVGWWLRSTASPSASSTIAAAAKPEPRLSLASAQVGAWADVTPAGIDLSPDYPAVAQNYGIQDVLADPVHPGTFFAFVCYQGCWKSADWGATWTKVSSDSNLEKGRPWGEAIAPDGSYMLACTGYGPIGAWKSSDGGATWTNRTVLSSGGHPNSFAIDPGDRNHVLASSHGNDHIAESIDGGESWNDRGSSGAGSANHVFLITSTTWIAVGDMHSGCGTRRTTDSGASWMRVGPMEHPLGTAQIVVDPDRNRIYMAAVGLYRSTDAGASFSKVGDFNGSVVFATATYLYGLCGGATQASVLPTFHRATRSDGTDWTPLATPAAMTNGPKRVAVAFNAALGKWVIVSGNWLAGIWRYVEP